MPSGAQPASRAIRSRKPRGGGTVTGSSGSNHSIGSMSICANCSGRKRSMATGSSVAAPGRTLVTTRVFDAPRERVYRAWTDPKQLAKWFPPEGFSAPRCEVDPRPGGVFRVDMKAPDGPLFDGKVFPGPGVFREAVPNEWLLFPMTPEIEPGQSMPMVLMSVRFEDHAGTKTKLTIEQTLPTVADYETMAKQGMAQGIN